MLNIIAQLTPGNRAKMTVLRKNQESNIDIVVGKRPKPRTEVRDEVR